MEAHARRAHLSHVPAEWLLDGWVTKVAIAGDAVAAGTAEGTVWLGRFGAAEPLARRVIDCEIADLCAHPGGWLVSGVSGDCVLIGDDGDELGRAAGTGGWRLAQTRVGYVSTDRNGSVALLGPSLELIWRSQGGPAWDLACDDDRVVVGTTTGEVSARRITDGTPTWSTNLEHPVYGCVSTSSGWLAGTGEGALWHLDPDGRPVGCVGLPAVRGVWSGPPGSDHVLVACADGSLRCFDTHLAPIWRFDTSSWVRSVAADGATIAVGSADHHLYLLDAFGAELSRLRAGHTVLAVARAGDRIVAGSADARLYTLDASHVDATDLYRPRR